MYLNSYSIKRSIGGAATFVLAGALMVVHGLVEWWNREPEGSTQ